MTSFEQVIYNAHLRAYRSCKNLPVTFRKDFDKLEETGTHEILRRLAAFFGAHPEVDVGRFFEAPYIVHPDTGFLPLSYYLTIPATRAYTLCKEKQDNESPDTDSQLERCTQSGKFLIKFCKANKIKICDYLHFVELGATTPSFYLALKNRDISIYLLLGFSQFEMELYKYDRDWLVFFFGQSFVDNIPKFKTRFLTSTKMKVLVPQILEIAEKMLENSVK